MSSALAGRFFTTEPPGKPPTLLLIFLDFQFSSVQLLICVWLFATPWTATCQASLAITNSWFTHTYVLWVGDAIQPSHPLSSPSLAFNLSQHQGLFKWVSFESGGQSMGVSPSASVLSTNIKDRFPLGLTDWISLLSKGLSRVFFSTTVQKHQFFDAQLPLQSNSHIHTWPLEKP